MAIMTTATHPKDLWPGIHAHFGLSYNEHPLQYKELYEIMGSNKAYEEDVERTGLGLAPIKSEGAAVMFDHSTQGLVHRYTHVTYALGYTVSREAIADGQYESVATRNTKALAFSMRQTKETVAANVYNRAFSGSYTFADGQPLISLTHPTRAGNQSNRMTVDADLSEAAIESLLIQIMQTLDSRGHKISLIARKLIVPPQLIFEAIRILKSALQSGGANNDTNALKDMGLIPEGVKVNHYLTDPDAWFLRTNAPNGMTMFQRESLVFTQDNDFNTDNQKAKAMERYSVGCTDFRGIFGSSGA